ncbi:MAG: nitronate monooxygenase [Gammaproteobacteria bacterium]|jgi:nitronate monooxygenase|uniref:NAD(P)H-dependent flavin oxidoreductase n=1 Tax=Marinomonas TaxID=28253 RepID=UPI000C1DE964|nr:MULTISPECIES: nitronate monooxygenase [unclassified Marinomonas]MBU1296844.1 nitronate monooxygenase [Gammaproteobacteria bacterium]MBU1467009.1 nitronate monooxygenase [Gammaproteobacteria bacterium]MBU2021157.1 nitronate monooxygenase [Gammaproteobacteria bacterium]MBU2237250.1 nitronate monooxygenase [Gammaproteobacteria bacterium]MBU2320300.1 nitronate monooxygenase [Gammaproteobacteria bacterium]
MNLFDTSSNSLKLPLIVAPMFLVSSPELAIASSKSGVVGSLPAANARTVEDLDQWMAQIHQALNSENLPWLFNMIVHKTYDRFDAEIELVKRYQPAIVSTALGSPTRVMEAVKSYGGKVIADVITPAMAKKAVDAGVDALILVTNGAGGHTGTYNPLAFIAEVRQFWNGPLGIAGCISTGNDLLAMLVAGADFALSGTRFIGAQESLVSDAYRDMLVEAQMGDVIETKAVSGVKANWMRQSLEKADIDPSVDNPAAIDFSGNISTANKAWKDVWSAGHGVGRIRSKETTAEIVDSMVEEFNSAISNANTLLTQLAKAV